MRRITFEDYLRENAERGIIDFSVRAYARPNTQVTFYIHPAGKDGDIPDFAVHDNKLTQINMTEGA